MNKRLILIVISQGKSRLELVRSVYFSLFGSSALNYVMYSAKRYFFEASIFVFGVLALLLGLMASIRIVSDFEMHQKAYDSYDEEMKKKYENRFELYVCEKEKGKVLGYYIFIFMWLLGMALIALSSFLGSKYL